MPRVQKPHLQAADVDVKGAEAAPAEVDAKGAEAALAAAPAEFLVRNFCG